MMTIQLASILRLMKVKNTFLAMFFGLEIKFTQMMNYQKDFQLSRVIYTTKHFLRRSFLVTRTEMTLAPYI